MALQSHRRPNRQSRPRKGRGFALLITLSAIVLLSAVVLAFFTRARFNRQLSHSSASLSRADHLSRFALEFVTGELRQEIVDGSNETTISGVSVYEPITPADAAPAKVGVSSPDETGSMTITKVSTGGEALRPSGSVKASPISINDRSTNGRRLSTDRWFGTGGPRLGSQQALPAWFYVTRSDGVTTPTLQDANDPTKTGYVVGRFACTIYDVSGLLNANVAGYPSVAAADAATKGSTAYADLEALTPGLDGNFDTFIRWRNGENDTTSAEAYANYLADEAMPAGFSYPRLDHNAFISRRDLLKGAAAQSTGLTEAVLPYFTPFSRALDAPSWGPATPTGSNIDYEAEANTEGAANRFAPNVRFANTGTVIHYRDDGTIEPSAEGDTDFSYISQAGDPLLRNRFSLAKLAWIGHDGPNIDAFNPALSPDDRDEAIRACFGLTWNESEFRWEYVETTPSPNAIKTLADVAAESTPREPNFFELLQAGILRGSVSQHPGIVCGTGSLPPPTAGESTVGAAGAYFKDTSGAQPSYSDEPSLHIVQIGANLIDQYDEDGYPTAIYFPAYPEDEAAQLYDFYNVAYGIENLPVLHRIYMLAMEDDRTPPDGAWDTPTSFKWWLVPEVWNPHQAPGTTSTDQPTHFRIRAHGRIYGAFGDRQLSTTLGLQGRVIDYDDDPTSPGEPHSYRDLYFQDLDKLGVGREKPVVLKSTMIDDSIAKNDPHNYYDPSLPEWDEYSINNSADSEFGYLKWAGIYAGSCRWPKDPSVSPWNSTGGLRFFSLQLRPDDLLSFTMECWDGSRWLPYSMVSRIAVYPVTNDAGNALSEHKPYDGGLTIAGRNTICTPDPRTDRFSSAFARRNGGNIGGGTWTYEKTCEPNPDKQMAIEQYYLRDSDGFEYPGGTLRGSTFASSANSTMWMVNLVNNPFAARDSSAYYPDRDGIVRPADGYRRDPDQGDGVYMLPGGVQPTSAGRRRPIILNRPFKTVGEMGYAYRDLPGKNLDFWSPDSPDSGLLDLFSVGELHNRRTTADVINPAAAPAPVLQAMLSGTLAHEASDPVYNAALSEDDAENLANTIADHFQAPASTPLASRGGFTTELADLINSGLPETEGLRANKALAEAPVRALAEVANTRTWNVMIDLVAQSGRVSPSAGDLADFVVEGEKRYWLHLAIDRLSGEVVSRYVEPVYE